MKFLNIIDKYQKTLVLEQDIAPATDLPGPEQPAPDSQESIDIPANIVTLSRMLKSAIIMNISPEDEDFIRKLIALNVDIDWDAISYNDKIILSEEFLDEFKDFIDFDLYEQRNEDYYENNPQY
jgi:hypothetical protein